MNALNFLHRDGVSRRLVLATFGLMPLFFFRDYVDSFTEGKWVFLYLASAILGCVQGFKNEWVRPRFSTVQNVLLVGLVCLALESTARYGWLLQSRVAIDRMVFVFWVWILWCHIQSPGFVQRLGYVLIPASVIVIAIGLAQIVGIDANVVPIGQDGHASLFGNHNFVAEFLAYTLVFNLLVLRSEPVRWRRFGIELVCGAALAYIVHLHCRAVYCGLVASLILLIAFLRILPLASGLRILIAAIGTYLLPFLSLSKGGASGLVTKLAETNPVAIALSKGATSLFERFNIWDVLLATAYHHPGGIGPGNFAFGHMPEAMQKPALVIREMHFWLHPHNELLRFLVEDGWVFTALLCVFFAILVRQTLGHSLAEGSSAFWRSDRGILLVGLGSIFLVTSAVSFPLYLSFSFLIGALLTAIALTSIPSLTWSPPRFFKISIPTVLALALVNLAYRIDFVEHVAREENRNERLTSQACDLMPNHWMVCQMAANANIHFGHFADAQRRLDFMLERTPLHYPALKTQAFLAAQAGKPFDECVSLWTYHSIFRGGTALSQRMNDVCGPVLLDQLRTSAIRIGSL